jgi:hypothetical protein
MKRKKLPNITFNETKNAVFGRTESYYYDKPTKCLIKQRTIIFNEKKKKNFFSRLRM